MPDEVSAVGPVMTTPRSWDAPSEQEGEDSASSNLKF